MPHDVVDEHHCVRTNSVLKVEVNPLMLHQAHDEIHVGFLILNAVVPGAVGSGQFFYQWITVARQYVVDDLGNRLELKNLAIAASAGDPEPRAKLGDVDQMFALATGIAKSCADTVKRSYALAPSVSTFSVIGSPSIALALKLGVFLSA